MMLSKSTLQLLRFHFSFFLLPVYLFALSRVENINWSDAVLLFVILHLLVYPSSNGYNSYMDRDESAIGGLAKPLQPTRQLFITTVVMDVVAIILAFLVSIPTVVCVISYILASRAYSYRGIRLKKRPIVGFMVVILFQGASVFFVTFHAASVDKTLEIPLLPLAVASLLIGGSYPLTQIYQHEADRLDGVISLSALLGIRGTFVFCGIVFAIATLLMFFTLRDSGNAFLVYIVSMTPLLIFFTLWANKAWTDPTKADFTNSLRMNILASVCTTICFGILLYLNIE